MQTVKDNANKQSISNEEIKGFLQNIQLFCEIVNTITTPRPKTEEEKKRDELMLKMKLKRAKLKRAAQLTTTQQENTTQQV